jgi:hypothetical protein
MQKYKRLTKTSIIKISEKPTMTAAQPDRLDHIEATLETVVQSLGDVRSDIKTLSDQVERTNERVEIYQKASGQVVNLAFGLLATAAAAIIIPALLNHR